MNSLTYDDLLRNMGVRIKEDKYRLPSIPEEQQQEQQPLEETSENKNKNNPLQKLSGPQLIAYQRRVALNRLLARIRLQNLKPKAGLLPRVRPSANQFNRHQYK